MNTDITINLTLNHHSSVTNKELRKALEKLDFVHWTNKEISLNLDNEVLAYVNNIDLSISEM